MAWERFTNSDQLNETQSPSRDLIPSTADWQGFNAGREGSWNGANQSLIANNLLPNTEITGTNLPMEPASGAVQPPLGAGTGEGGWTATGGSGTSGGWSEGGWGDGSWENSANATGEGRSQGWHHHHHHHCEPHSASGESGWAGGELLVDKLLSDPTLYHALQSLQEEMTPEGFSELEQSLAHYLANTVDSTGSGGDGGAGTTTMPTTGGDGTVTTTTPTTGGDGTVTTTTPTTGGDGTVTTTTPTTGGDGTITTPTTGGDRTGTTTTTPTPLSTSPSGALAPDVPAGVNVPSNLVLNDNFSSGSLNTSLWSPTWFGNGSQQNNTTMEASNVSVGPNGLNLTDTGTTGAIVSTNPNDGQPGHTGFQLTNGLVQFTVDVPASSNGQIANWPAFWLVGQNWPQDGEIDVMEGLGGTAAWHEHYGSSSDPQSVGQSVNTSPGEHTYDVLINNGNLTFYYDGKDVGQTTDQTPNSPMYLVMENSNGGQGTTPDTVTVKDVEVWQ